VRVNSGYDPSGKNLVNFGAVIAEMTELIRNLWDDTAKITITNRISQNVLERSSLSFSIW